MKTKFGSKKSLAVLGVLLMLLGICAAAGWQGLAYLRQDVIYIAVVGPMSGEGQKDGDNMVKGIRLCLDKLRESGELPKQRIELLIEDQNNPPRSAAEIARKIVQEDRVLAVVGYVYSDLAIEAGKVYRQAEIPAVTASASADAVTLGNDWFFRVIPNNRIEGMFVANYIKNALNQTAASIIYLDNDYGNSLYRAFETTAPAIGLHIEHEWKIQETPPTDLDRLIQEIIAAGDPGVIFMATYGDQNDAKIIATLRATGKNYTFFGSDGYAEPMFLDSFKDYPQEFAPPGYYTDGIYGVTPFMPAIGDKEAFDFQRAFYDRYGTYPDAWMPFCFYDAMQVVVQAIKDGKIEGSNHLRRNRKKLRATLAGFYQPPDHAVKSVSGYVYFSATRDVNRPMGVGFFRNRLILPAFTQYQLLSDANTLVDRIASALKREIIIMDDQIMDRTQIVRTGVTIHQISGLDLSKGRYTLDFSLWLRFEAGLDAARLTFVNAVQPVPLGQPVFEETVNQITTQVYRVRAEFRGEVDFRQYPFDQPVLSIQFRHATKAFQDVIYVPDGLGAPPSVTEANARQTTPPALADWQIVDDEQQGYQDAIQTISVTGVTTYSTFYRNLRLAHNQVGFFVRVGAPFIGAVALFGLALLCPAHWLGQRLALVGAIFVLNLYFHFRSLPDGRLAYLVNLEYGFLAIYAGAVLLLWNTIARSAWQHRLRARLDALPLFAHLPEESKTALGKRIRRRYWRAGRTIVRQDAPGDSMFMILKGAVAFWQQAADIPPAQVAPPDDHQAFGELSLLTGAARLLTVKSAAASLGEIRKRDLLPLLRKQPDLVNAFSAELARLRLRRENREDPAHAPQLDQAALTAEFRAQINRFFGLSDSQ